MADGSSGRRRRSTSVSDSSGGATTRRAAGSGSRTIPKLQRWVDLLAALLSRRFPVTMNELQQDVPAYRDATSEGALERMFERDKKELRDFGIPIETVQLDREDPSSSGYQLRARDFYLPYLTVAGSVGTSAQRSRAAQYGALPTLAFQPDELSAIGAAAARVRTLGDPHLAADVDSALRKLALDLPMDAAQPGEEELVVAHPVERKTFSALGSAVRQRKIVEFDYHKMGDDTTGRRSVEPLGLAFLGSNWYLVARDRGHGELRHFRLSRMSNVKVNEKRALSPDFDVPAGFSLAEHAKSRETWELGDGDAVEVIVEFRFTNGAVHAAAQLGEPVQGSASRRRFRVRRGDAFVRWLLSFGGAAVPVEPGAIAEQLHRVAGDALRRYEEPASVDARLDGERPEDSRP